MNFPKINFSIFYIIAIMVAVSALAATYDYIKINSSEQTIINNQVKGNESVKEYINCLLNLHPGSTLHSQEIACLSSTPKVKQ